MLPDLSPTHILIVVVVALIVVGPKDLPMLLRKVGQFMARMRGMANEFRASFDEMARQSELDELRREVEAMREAAGKAVPDLSLNDPFKDESHGRVIDHWQAIEEASTVPVPEPTPIPAPTTVSVAEPDAAPPPAKKPRARKPKPPTDAAPEPEA